MHVQTDTQRRPPDLTVEIEGPMLLEPASERIRLRLAPRLPQAKPQDNTLSHKTQLSRDITTPSVTVSEQRTGTRG